ncbi:Detected protein of unknown function [Hibiscus syriacus]|uniref:Uncharacterized protein n=1 Tax=Hibiscus syriacus TaxID=106335 RepID=A0A6A2ZDT3_HIBSY|nr:uncharacterized protein LOC120146835 [Hibiscus syriacus]KAE8689736.1 Detected protein of unknown function [Hibiscus syriacus]
MMLSSNPISSPCRADKYPPQLMRFLTSKGASRSSRGRSRSSPMFVRKKKAAVETQEPSSPKVTCVGQVRVKQTGSKSGPPGAPTRPNSRCKWITEALFCIISPGKSRSSLLLDLKENGEASVSALVESPPLEKIYRKSKEMKKEVKLRFCESPLASHGTSEETEQKTEYLKKKKRKPIQREFICENGFQMEENPDFCNEFEEKTENSVEQKAEQMGNVGPLVLTRCKSEPARTAARLHSPMSFRKKITLGFT